MNWNGVQLSECYCAAVDANLDAVENVKVSLKESLLTIQAQYEAQATCVAQGATFAELWIGSELQSCALVDPALHGQAQHM